MLVFCLMLSGNVVLLLLGLLLMRMRYHQPEREPTYAPLDPEATHSDGIHIEGYVDFGRPLSTAVAEDLAAAIIRQIKSEDIEITDPRLPNDVAFAVEWVTHQVTIPEVAHAV